MTDLPPELRPVARMREDFTALARALIARAEGGDQGRFAVSDELKGIVSHALASSGDYGR